MAGILDDMKLEITCPGCKAKLSKTIGDAKRIRSNCPKCGVPIKSSTLKPTIAAAEKQLKNLSK
jgi:transcription initiation factor IIE alpha subunit